MAKVLTFSRYYPAGHIYQGNETFFVEKFLNALQIDFRNSNYFMQLTKLNEHNEKLSFEQICKFFESLDPYCIENKIHTIRIKDKEKKFRFQPGDLTSPRVWTSKPYTETQIIFAPDQKIIDVEPLEASGMQISVNGIQLSKEQKSIVAGNDGLSLSALNSWFQMPNNFEAGVISWKETNYKSKFK